MIEDQALSVRVSGKVDSDEKNMHIATCYRILMLAKMKRGKSVMQKKIFAMANQMLDRLKSQAGFIQIESGKSYSFSNWDGWRLFEGYNLRKWDQTLQSLQRAPDPDPFVPNIVNGQFDWRGITYKDGTQVKDKNGNPFGVSTPQNPYPVNKGGIEIDRWLETQFIVNTSKKKCKAPPKITAGQTVTISAETLDLIPPGTSIANIVVDNVPKVTFTLIGGADRFELENKSGTTGHQVIEDTAENGIAEITLKPK